MRGQYLKAIEVFDSENSRFWTRFNLFTGLQPDYGGNRLPTLIHA